jgi:hypothetical protein
VAEKLGIRVAIPCIFLESLAYTTDGRCIEVLRSTYRGDRYLFRVEAGGYRREMASGGSAEMSLSPDGTIPASRFEPGALPDRRRSSQPRPIARRTA